MRPTLSLGLGLCALLFSLGCAPSGGSLRDPGFTTPDPNTEAWSTSSKHPTVAHAHPPTWSQEDHVGSPGRSGIIELAYRLYSNHLTRVDGARCDHRPSCSRYAIEAMRAHGVLVGAWLGIDRLLRSSHSSSLKMLPVKPYGKDKTLYLHDPVEANDFFF